MNVNANTDFTNFILSSSKNIKILFIFLFSIFGLTIAFISYFVILYYENKNMQDELFNTVKSSFVVKESIIVFFISIPIAFVLSIVPVRLSNKLIETQDKLTQNKIFLINMWLFLQQIKKETL